MNDMLTFLGFVLVVVAFACITPNVAVVVLEKRLPSFSPLYPKTRRFARLGQALAIASMLTATLGRFM